MDIKISKVEEENKQNSDEFMLLSMIHDSILYKYKGRRIILPTESVCESEDEDDVQCLFMVSSAFYEGTSTKISPSDAKDLTAHLTEGMAEDEPPLLIE